MALKQTFPRTHRLSGKLAFAAVYDARVRESRGLSEEDARSRLANQSPQEEKVAAADVVIDGSAPLAETRRQVTEAYARLVTPTGGPTATS